MSVVREVWLPGRLTLCVCMNTQLGLASSSCGRVLRTSERLDVLQPSRPVSSQPDLLPIWMGGESLGKRH